jgi:hypothetical protein
MEDHQYLPLQDALTASQHCAHAICLILEEHVHQDDRAQNPASSCARWSVIENLVLNPAAKRGNRVYTLWQVANLLYDLLKKEIPADEKTSAKTREGRAHRNTDEFTETDVILLSDFRKP